MTDERKDKQKSSCILQDFVPFGAAAQKEEQTSSTLLEIVMAVPHWFKFGKRGTNDQYTVYQVACGWARAVMKMAMKRFGSNSETTFKPTDRPTD